MREFKYTISDPMGFHARPVGFVAKLVSQQNAKVTVIYKDKSADCRRLYQVLALGIKQGDEVTFKIDGDNEETIEEALIKLFTEERL